MAEPEPAIAETPPEQRKLTRADQDILAAELRLAFHYQRARWDAIRAGVALGADEVQDQRLSAAEAPPEVDPAFELFVVLFTVLLEGPVAGWIARGLQASLASALRAELKLQGQAYRALLKLDTATAKSALREAQSTAAKRSATLLYRKDLLSERGLARRARRVQAAIKEADAADQEVTAAVQRLRSASTSSAGFGTLRRTSSLLKGIRSDSVPEWIIGAEKGAFQRAQQIGSAPEQAIDGPAAGPSAGVLVRAAVEKQALERVQELWFQQECLEVIVRSEDFVIGQAIDLYEAFAMTVPVDSGQIIDHYQLLTAALIWARLLNVSGLRRRRWIDQDTRSRSTTALPSDQLAPGSRQAVPLATAPEKHVDYLVARFGAAAEAWARGAPQDVALPSQMLKGPTDLTALESYIRGGAPTGPAPGLLERAFVPKGATPKELRLDLVMQFLDATVEHTPDLGISSATG
jgi:hypothetical protein